MGQVVAGIVAIGTLVVVGSIVYQIVNGKHSVALGSDIKQGTTQVVSTLYKN